MTRTLILPVRVVFGNRIQDYRSTDLAVRLGVSDTRLRSRFDLPQDCLPSFCIQMTNVSAACPVPYFQLKHKCALSFTSGKERHFRPGKKSFSVSILITLSCCESTISPQCLYDQASLPNTAWPVVSNRPSRQS